jgi:phosphatidylglycerophosphatase A
MTRLVLWVAQGFGIGRIPFAPGTFGSVLGLLWMALLLCTGRLWLYACGCLFGVAASIWFCGRAERILGETDPGSVVLDEVAAMPICFAAWLWSVVWWNGEVPAPGYFFAGPGWPGTVVFFVTFRLFDVVKPWPVRQSQALPGGWGITIDDVLAAGYVNLTAIVLFKTAAWIKS